MMLTFANLRLTFVSSSSKYCAAQVAVHHHLDQPIMTIKELDVAPGSLVQVAVTPTLTSTSQVPS